MSANRPKRDSMSLEEATLSNMWGIAMRAFILAVVVLSTGCTTQHVTSVHPTHVVVSCIAQQWNDCGSSGFKVPVYVEREPNGYILGVGRYLFFVKKGYHVWAQVTDTGSGSATEYNRDRDCFGQAVQACQGPSPGCLPSAVQ